MDGREPTRGRRSGGGRRAADQEHLFVAPSDASAYQAGRETDAPVYQAGREADASAYQSAREADAPVYRPGRETDAPGYQAGRETDAPTYQAGREADMPGYQPTARPDSDAAEPDFRYVEPGKITMANYRRRDLDAAMSGSEQEPAFAAPVKMRLPTRGTGSAAEPLTEEQIEAEPHPGVNYYQTALPHQEQTYLPNEPSYEGYQVAEAEQAPRLSKSRRRKRMRKRVIALAAVLAVLGGGAYLGRDWLAQQWRSLSGAQTPAAGQDQAVTASGTAESAKAYDPAPAREPSQKAEESIAAIMGDADMETVAVTGGNIVRRRPRENGRYDYYLFTDTGLLVGYYEDMAADGFVVCQNDCFYVAEPPYLIGGDGMPLLDLERYAQYTGTQPVLEPLQNGWAIIRNETSTMFNYVDANGVLLNTLWFAKAFPFLGASTLAYVDSGNPEAGEERYSLYVIDQNGSASVWKRTGDMDGVIGVACEMAYLQTGELVRLTEPDTPLCVTDQPIAYVDCGAVVARDSQSGLYGLYVQGEQHYDFAYQSIEPVPCELTWRKTSDGAFTYCAVYGAAYPQPLSHYFTLTRDGQTERIALSTASTYPVSIR